jgi:hypothetical protein
MATKTGAYVGCPLTPTCIHIGCTRGGFPHCFLLRMMDQSPPTNNMAMKPLLNIGSSESGGLGGRGRGGDPISFQCPPSTLQNAIANFVQLGGDNGVLRLSRFIQGQPHHEHTKNGFPSRFRGGNEPGQSFPNREITNFGDHNRMNNNTWYENFHAKKNTNEFKGRGGPGGRPWVNYTYTMVRTKDG